MKIMVLILITLIGVTGHTQELSGEQLLEKTIRFHDPEHAWSSFHGKLNVTMNTTDGNDRVSEIIMNLPQEFFKVSSVKDNVQLEQTIARESCTLMLNGSTDFTKKEAETHRLNCKRAKMYRDYYTYLYGLPMKLKDNGTLIDPKVTTKTFKGKEYLVLKATYEKEVGDDIWYFYFDPKTYAMEVYQFFHDESARDGEYILLNGIENVAGIKIPKSRAWYYNKDDKYLGTDVLTTASEL